MRYAIQVQDGVDLLTGSSPLAEGAITPVKNWDEMIVVPWFFLKIVDGEVTVKTEQEQQAYLDAHPPTTEELQEAAKQHLDDSDWYITRFVDPGSGVTVPQDILDSRVAAREIL